MKLNISHLLGISFAIRFLIACLLDLGNDEVYYITYATHPDWSHFDHPSMVGWFIQIFSLNLLSESEWVIRLSSLVMGTLHIWLIYRITLMLSNHRAAILSALLAMSSVFLSVLCGIFILPDTPLMTFWLLALFYFTRIAFRRDVSPNRDLLLAGLFAGLAMLSKYQAVFLWVGFGGFVLLRRRSLLRSPALYLSVVISLLCLLPILIWNYQNQFISFTFHSERVSFFEGGIQLQTLLQEIGGSLFYNNVVLAVLVWIVLFKRIARQSDLGDAIVFLKICAGTLISIVIFMSLWRQTLPHWTAPAFTSMIPVVAIYLSSLKNGMRISRIALSITVFILVLGTMQIRWGILPLFDYSGELTKTGRNDFTLDMYGWERCGLEIKSYLQSNANGDKPVVLISHKWFPSAHFDHYVARPLGLPLLVSGGLHDVHKFAWLNAERMPKDGAVRLIYLTDSHNYKSPKEGLGNDAVVSQSPHVIPIYRNGIVVKNVFVFEVDTMSLDHLKCIPSYIILRLPDVGDFEALHFKPRRNLIEVQGLI